MSWYKTGISAPSILSAGMKQAYIYLIPKANWLNLVIADQLVINCYPKITPVWISPLGGIENWPNYNSGSCTTPWPLAEVELGSVQGVKGSQPQKSSFIYLFLKGTTGFGTTAGDSI